MKITYRPEIDGLRAIAVAAVILYHAQISIFESQLFRGGFIGVDIFFVISGYLITTIILKELLVTGQFSFKNFYERRIRRILPALIFIMLVSIPFAWMFLLPNSLIDFSKSILYSLGFSSNFYFHYSGQQYDAESSLLKPFLHTWSLSVEEQYYIIFPIALLIVFKFLRKYLIHILIIGLLISLGIADWGSKNFSSLNFYYLPSRGWELLAGSILAYYEIKIGHRSLQKNLNLVLPSIGLLLILINIFFFKFHFPHPSIYTLPSIIGVCLIIWFSNSNELVTKILSSKLLVGFGLISYSLYLWHYPIFAFSRYVEDITGNQTNIFFIISILLLLSIFSFYFIEKPFRNRSSKKLPLKIIFISIFLLLLVNFLIISKHGYKDRFQDIIVEKNYDGNLWDLLKDNQGKSCLSNKDLCFFNKNKKDKIFLIGDSHTAVLSLDLKNRILKKKKYTMIVANRSGCIFFPKFNLIFLNDKKKTKCNDEYFSKLNNLFTEKDDNIIIFGGRFSFYTTEKTYDNGEGGKEYSPWFENRTFSKIGKFDKIENSFKESVQILSNKNKIILVYPIPEQGWNVPKKLHYQLLFKKNKNNLNDKNNWITTSYDSYKKRTSDIFRMLDSISGDNIYRVYPHKLFCDTMVSERCISHDDKDLFYGDDDHPSLKGAEMINELIMKEIEKIELKPL